MLNFKIRHSLFLVQDFFSRNIEQENVESAQRRDFRLPFDSLIRPRNCYAPPTKLVEQIEAFKARPQYESRSKSKIQRPDRYAA